MMRKLLMLSVLGACGLAHAAHETCGMQATRLLQAGDVAGLARMFNEPDAAQASIATLRQKLGDISQAEAASKPRFAGRHLQLKAGALPRELTYRADWINAESTLLGPIQLEYIALQDQPCRLRAVLVDHRSAGGSQ